ncbi:hypothetical protein HY546_03080 [archaeon]|nr:hypothetical protein [archaeon]
MGSFERNLASARLSFMEKYKYAYEEDLNFVRDFMGADVVYSPDNRKARVSWNNFDFEVEVRQAGKPNNSPGYKPGAIIEI